MNWEWILADDAKKAFDRWPVGRQRRAVQLIGWICDDPHQNHDGAMDEAEEFFLVEQDGIRIVFVLSETEITVVVVALAG